MQRQEEQGQVYEQIEEDEECSQQINKNDNEIYYHHSQPQTIHPYFQTNQQQLHPSPQQQQFNQHPPQQQPMKENHSNHNSESYKINYQTINQYQSYFLQSTHDKNHTIHISINKNERRGSLMSYYYVYLIEGHDNKGNFSIARRFNEFYEMRVAMVSRWPGCFVPSIPAKNALAKNDATIIKRRTRYLDDFVKKLSRLPHLYYGEQFQTLLRSQQVDVSETFSKWAKPASQSIINKYRVNFSSLAGKQLNFETQQKIEEFHQLMKKNQSQLVKEREAVKQLAQSYDRVIKSYASLFASVFPLYEKDCYSIYAQANQSQMLYLNQEEVKLQEHLPLAKQATAENPYWLLYDLIRHEERDALAFSEVFLTKLQYEQKATQIQQKIIQYQRNSNQLSNNKRPTSSLKLKPEEVRQKMQAQLSQMQRQKQNILIIIDLISAMIAYIEIERYKKEKTNCYRNVLGKICISQISSVQNLIQIWSGVQDATDKKMALKEGKQVNH